MLHLGSNIFSWIYYVSHQVSLGFLVCVWLGDYLLAHGQLLSNHTREEEKRLPEEPTTSHRL